MEEHPREVAVAHFREVVEGQLKMVAVGEEEIQRIVATKQKDPHHSILAELQGLGVHP